MEENGDPLRYDELILKQLNEIGSRVTNFAITNYAASGAIFLAFFATKLQSWIIVIAVIVVNCNFITAIAHNIWVSKRLFQMHTIARNAWFENKTKNELRQSLENDDLSREMLRLTASDLGTKFDFSTPAVVSNLIPTLGAVGLLIMNLIGVPLRSS